MRTEPAPQLPSLCAYGSLTRLSLWLFFMKNLLACLAFIACLPCLVAKADTSSVNVVARQYVGLVLALGEYDPAYVDAYYGPQDWRDQALAAGLSPADIEAQADALISALPPPAAATDDTQRLRLVYLERQLASLAARARALENGESVSFETQAQSLYDTVPPRQPLSSFDPVLEELSDLLPGKGPLHVRSAAFTSQYEVPQERVGDVMAAAIEECRKRTTQWVDLPQGETFTLEYVTGKSWGGYNWYQGKAYSRIQINIGLPIRIDRAVDLGCHEGYPGHHTYNALLEQNLVVERGWVEFSVYALFSPQSLIAEGAANYGAELAFPGTQRIAYEQNVLYPLAGLDPATAPHFQRYADIATQLSFARIEIARQYINGDIDREEAVRLNQRYGPVSLERAENMVQFVDDYGAYIINYSWGKALVRDFIESGADTEEGRWRRFIQLLSSPRLPSTLAD